MSAGQEHVGDVDALEQREELADVAVPVAVPVHVDGPVQVHLVPAVAGAAKSVQLTDGEEPLKIANADERRRSLLLVGVDGPFYVAFSKGTAGSSTAPLWPQSEPLALHHQQEVYAWAGDAGGTALSVIVEQWAD